MNLLKSKFLTVYLLTFVNGLSFTLLIPVLPFIIKQYNQPEIVLGILLSTYSFFQFFGSPIVGALSDKFGRKKVLLLTQGGTFLSWIILGTSYLVPEFNILGFIFFPIFLIFLSRFIDGITGGNVSVLKAIVSDLTEREERSVIFGRTGAITGVTLIIGPSLGAFTMGTEFGYLASAIVGGTISAVALLVIIFVLKESLKEEDKQKDLKISFSDTNIYKKVRKYWGIENFNVAVILKLLMFFAFTMYTTVSVLYLIDNFGFSESTVGYYLILTGGFLILHQMFSIKYFVAKIGDLYSLILGQSLMFGGFLTMGLSPNIYLYTFCYFFAVLGIALSMTTLNSIFSKSADSKSQGEVMGISESLNSLMSIIGPLVGSALYTYLNISIFIVISIVPLTSVLIYLIFFRSCKVD